MPIRRKPIKILSTHQSNRLLVYKPPRIRLIIPEEVVMQPCFRIIILVLQSEGVICTIRYLGFLFQSAPDGVVGEPNQIVVLIGNLFREADFGRSGSCGFVDRFRLLRLSNRGLVPRVCNCRDRCKYKYICRPVGLPARDDCRPKRSGFPLRGCLRSRSRVRAYRAHFTSGLEVSCRLRLAIHPTMFL